MNYSNVGIKSGNVLYISSKTKEKGFDVESPYDGKTYYHKELDSIKGKLSAKKLEGGKFGERIKLFLNQDENNSLVLEVPTIMDDSLLPWAVELAKFLPNINIGDEIEISTNTSKKDKDGRPYKNLYITANGQSVPWAFKLEDVPKPEQKKSKLKGDVTWDFSARDEFLYDIIKKSLQAAAKEAQEAHTPEGYKSSKKNKPVESKSDLPF